MDSDFDWANFETGACFSKCQRLFGPEKKFVKQRSVHFEELIFEHISMSVENKTIAKFHELKRFPY